MTQISMPLSEKLDSFLADLCNEQGLSASARVPVVLRCDKAQLASVSERVAATGGKVRHQLSNVGAVVAWVPIFAVSKLAADDAVRAIELEQEFTVA